ncbi:MAG: anaerobic glycerol-3-phosphate dehydrogenase subunit GlpC [Bacteroidales bacterium]
MERVQYNISENNFEKCLKCTICTTACPVSAVNPSFGGPKVSGPDGERLRLKKPFFFDESLKYCLNCKRCEVACPSDVKIGDIIQGARIKHSKSKPRLRDIMLSNTDIMGRMATLIAPVVNTSLRLNPVKKMMEGILAIDSHRTFPSYASQKFESWYHKYTAKQQLLFDKKVAFFHGCYVNYNNPQLGKDLLRVMNSLGYGVLLLEKEACCGVALIANGLIKQATQQARDNIRTIRKAVVDQGLTVLGASSTCMLTLREEYPSLLQVNNDDVKDHMELATRFIYRLINEGKVKIAFKKDYKAKVVYHTPCHMEKLGWSIYSTSLIRMIPGVHFEMLNSQCCGIAGTYGFKKENYAASQEIGEGLFRQIRDARPDMVATDCETCKWQIEMSTGVRTENPISIFANAIDVEKTMALNARK